MHRSVLEKVPMSPDEEATYHFNGHLLVAIQKDTAFVHVVGRGSYRTSSGLKDFGQVAFEAGCHELVMDMADCTGMDSTFMGVLAGLAFRLKQQCRGEVLLVNLSVRTYGMLATLGLDQVIRPYMEGSTPPQYEKILDEERRLEALEHGPESRRTTAETMLEAHEHLVEISPDNQVRFKDVLTYLREELRKHQPEDLEGTDPG